MKRRRRGLVVLAFHVALLAGLSVAPVRGETIRVPIEHPTIQAAIDAASPGDIVLVSAGRYRERLKLRPGVVVRSAGSAKQGRLGLVRAEAAIIDAGGAAVAAVEMRQAAVLDGFTITNVGGYDESIWKRHHASQGEELADDEGAVPDDDPAPLAAIAIPGVGCQVLNNIVHHNGLGGIAVRGGGAATPALIANNHCFRNMGGGVAVADNAVAIVRGNLCRENLRAGIGCRKASPLIENNECAGNVRAGIGCREGAAPVIRGNKCWRNRRAGIGIRMEGSAPLVVDNKCYENDMAGIGCRDGASPLIRGNECLQNRLAGIGVDGAHPLIVANRCLQNQKAGIGLRGAAQATILDNQCLDNRLVAIGVTNRSEATIQGNRLLREGGAPPLLAVLDQSQAHIRDNQFFGGGVAALMIQGEAVASGNRFFGADDKQGNAIWVRERGAATIQNNRFVKYAAAVHAVGAKRLSIVGNEIRNPRNSALVVRGALEPPHVFGNRVHAKQGAKVLEINGLRGVVQDNELLNP